MKSNKKAQAAMEFLTTYGWAILILIIVIVGLASLGVFKSPNTPNTCSISAPFGCNDITIRAWASNALNPRNNVTLKANNVISMTVGGFVRKRGTCTGVASSDLFTPPVSFNGEGVNYIALICPASTAGEKEAGQFDVTYTLTSSSTAHKITLFYSATRE